jgi:hypothetical protein
MKICSCCKEEKAETCFYKRYGKLRPECKVCSNKQNTATVTSEAKSRSKARYRESNRELLNKKHSDYKKNNRALHNAQWMRYHTKKLNASPPWLTKEHHEQIKSVYAHAKECEMLTGDKYHVDHIVPLQGENVSGLHVPWNLQVLPSDINIAKSNNYE